MSSHRILVADDSALYRRLLTRVLNAHPKLEVVAVAEDGQQAVDLTEQARPDAIVLDINMPRMNGFEALESIHSRTKIPTIMISAGAAQDAQLAVRAVALGAIDLFVKPGTSSPQTASEALGPLADLVVNACFGRSTSASPPARLRSRGRSTAPDVLAFGSSTGGVAALTRLASALDPAGPAAVVAQHMPVGFTRSLARQLNQASPMEVVESEPGMELKRGRMIVCATDDHHWVVRRTGFELKVERESGEKEHHQRPAVDRLFRSVAAICGRTAVGLLLTGMGRDGATGLLAMRNAGARTIAESEDSAVVFGMPRAAIELEAATDILSLEEIREELSSITAANGVSL